MAGIKGKSGGQRPGAGRPKKPPAKLTDSELLTKALQQGDPRAFLLAVMADADNDARLRVDAAKALLPYECQKKGKGGKKEEAVNAAKKVGHGKFAPGRPPRLANVHTLHGGK